MTDGTINTASHDFHLAYGEAAEVINACLRAGREPDVAALIDQYPQLADEIPQLR